VALNNPPTVTAKDINLTEGDKIDTNSSGIDIVASDIDGTISRYIFKDANTTLYDGATLPTTLSALSVGEHNLSIRVVDNHDLNCTEDTNITIIVKIGVTNLRKTKQTISYADYDDGYYQYGGVDTNYTTDSNGNVKDNLTGIVWDDNGTVVGTKYGYNDLINNTYKTICDYYMSGLQNPPPNTIWRGPTRKEMLELLDYNGTNPAIDSIFNNYDSEYWTATTDGSKSFNIDFGLIKSEITNIPVNSTYDPNINNVHCIDDTNIKPIKDANFTIKGIADINRTVIDYNTMLEWQDNNISDDMNWTRALNYCHDLNLSENGIDWRVPNVRELLSIVDDNATNPSIDGNFTQTANGDYWTSTGKITDYAYKVSFSNGDMNAGDFISVLKKVRCVRTRREASFYP